YHVSRVYCLCFTVPILLLLYLYYSVYTHPPPTQIYTLSLHDALPISCVRQAVRFNDGETARTAELDELMAEAALADAGRAHDTRSEEHTSELQSRGHLVCRLLLEKKKTSSHHQTYLHELHLTNDALYY